MAKANGSHKMGTEDHAPKVLQRCCTDQITSKLACASSAGELMGTANAPLRG